MSDRHRDFDIVKLKDELKDKHKQNFQLDGFVLQTLNQFAHRYLPAERGEDVKAVSLDARRYGVKSIETDMGQTIESISDENVAARIRDHSPKALLYGLYVEIEQSNLKGRAGVLSFINWAAPDFPMTKAFMVQRDEALDFDDPLELRNKLPMALESACLLFV
ncbi:MAG: hypothetical protein OXB88_05780 [Bacteriovoracales bacterium]|nr:hypothetical protein [Bacteriovoracales bacterium]